ncbi:MAG: hypothetical protein ACI8YO_000574, partial [Gammaproteobacteria bacterium]
MKNSIVLVLNIIVNRLKIVLSIVLLGVSLNLSAQQSINASGGEATGFGHVSYSIGQIVYTAIESVSDDASIIQGVQIPFEEYVVSSCPTDFNIDGITNGDDFAIFLGNFNLSCTGCPTDLNDDGET